MARDSVKRLTNLVVPVVAFVACCLGEPAAPALSGVVVDPTHSPIEGARITVWADGRGTGASVISGPGGRFTVTLKPGAYTLRVSAGGFSEIAREIGPDEIGAGTLEIVMTVASRSEVLMITDTADYRVIASESTRTPTPLIDVPQSITVVTGQLLRDQAMRSMADVVRYIPGITMAQGEGHRDAPVIRGNATTADFYVNGVRDDVQYYRDVYNVERVEAVKGANALTFGRGGGGGVINRVTKDANFSPLRSLTMDGGSFGVKRFSTDLGHNFGDRVAVRLNALYENSDSYRRSVGLERYGIAPSLTWRASERTQVRVNYENFSDDRTVDRGIPSFNGGPSPADRRTFFGDPANSYATADVNLGSLTVEHQFSNFNLRNSTLIGDYDKYYRNVFAGAVNPALTQVSISGYGNLTLRRNVFNQTDLTGVVTTGPIRHTLLAGTEFGRQKSINFRNTAFWPGNATAINLPFGNPALENSGATFRQSATDADNSAINHVSSVFVQDQVELSRYIQVVAGVRYDYFSTDFHNNRNGERLDRQDHMVSPRAGLILKPLTNLSLYTSYSVAYLPSSGDQFSSLTTTTQTLKPEQFKNYEAGAKWDARRNLTFTAAVYRLDRTNTTARDPNDPSRLLQTGSQRTNGVEVGVNGNITRRWLMTGGYAWQDAFISNPTTAALAGARIALVPRHTLSLWNNYRILPRLSAGLGVIQQASLYTGIDNTVRLPSFTRADIAAFYSLTEKIRLQANVENLFDRTYYPTAHSNNNIMPGSPRAIRVGLTARF
ncbi:MAG: TonB-dependent siderophore receptor [Bryobacteraceae bacterium]|nr:TonB-dependent siderophore receptor [Bryobacteraceae bacterium]